MSARPVMTHDERRRRLAVRHRLAPTARTDDIVAIADGLVALHSTDPVTVYLSAAARMVHPDRSSLETALYSDRTLIRHHAMRRTLWVLTPDVARVVHAATTVAIATRERKKLEQLLAANGINDGPRWLRAAATEIIAVLAEHGPMTARDLGRRIPALRTPLVMNAGARFEATVAAHTRIMLVLGFEGELVRTRPSGTWINGEYRWAPMREWVPEMLDAGSAIPSQQANATLAERWLRAFGPAPAGDLQWWTGWTAATTKAALAAIGAVEVDLEGTTGWLMADDLDPTERPEPWAAVLPGLDPTTMGWKQRDWFLPPELASQLFDRNGNAGPTVWLDGRIVGGWVQRRDGDLALGLLVPVTRGQQRLIEAELERVRATVGDTRFTVRFPSPQQASLL